MDIFSQLAEKIIQQQENIVGPLALEQARKVPGLKLDWNNHQVEVEGDKTNVLEQLIEQYKYLFGQTSVEVCKDAVKGLVSQIPQEQLPMLLK
jgi:hypothetical protein